MIGKYVGEDYINKEKWWRYIVMGIIQIILYIGLTPIVLLSQNIFLSKEHVMYLLIIFQCLMTTSTVLITRGYSFYRLLKVWFGYVVTFMVIIISSYSIFLYIYSYNLFEYNIVSHVQDIIHYVGHSVLVKFIALVTMKMIVDMVIQYVLTLIDLVMRLRRNRKMEDMDNELIDKDYLQEHETLLEDIGMESVSNIENDRIRYTKRQGTTDNKLTLGNMYEDYNNVHSSYKGDWLE